MWGLAAVVFAVAIVGGFFAWASLQPEGPIVAYIHDGNIDTDIERDLRAGYDRADQYLNFVARDYAVLSDMTETMRKVADDGADLILTTVDFAGFVEEIAPDYPNTQFVVLTEGYVIENSPNVATATFDNVEGAYMVGVAAALSTRTDTVGFIGAAQMGFLQDFLTPYIAGVHATNPDIDVLVDWVSSDFVETPQGGVSSEGFARPDLAREAALNQYSNGADVVFTAAGESGAGTIQAAADYSSETGQKVWAIGVDSDEGFTTNGDLEQYVLTSMVKQFDNAIYQSVAAYLDGTLEPVTVFSLASGEVGYSDYGGYVDDIKTELDAVESALKNEQIVIPTVSAYPSTWRAGAQQYLDVTYDGSSCRPSRPPTAKVGETMSITFVNATADEASIAVAAMPGNVTDEELALDAQALDGAFPAILANGGSPLVFWTIPANSQYEIRTTWPGGSLEAAVINCWSPENSDSLETTSGIFMVSRGE